MIETDNVNGSDSLYEAAKRKLTIFLSEQPLRLQELERSDLEEQASNDSRSRRYGSASIEQKCVNYLRHCASAYPKLIEMLSRPDEMCESSLERHVLHVERRRGVAFIKKRILNEIAAKYHWLAAECERQKARDGVEDDPGDYEMPFGPFKRRRLRELDSDYLLRLLGQSFVRKALRTRIERHLAERDAALEANLAFDGWQSVEGCQRIVAES